MNIKSILQKRYYIPFVAVLVLTAIILSLILPFQLTVNADKGFISFTVQKNVAQASPADTYQLPSNRHFYLSTWSGNGTHASPFIPTVVVGQININWGAIDLRANSALVSGYCIAYADTDSTINGTGIRYIGNSPFTTLLAADKMAISTALGNVSITSNDLADYLNELLNTTQRIGLCKPIKPDNDGQTRLYLGGLIYGNPMPPTGHTTITESFNKADASFLGPDHTWSTPDGAGWGVASHNATISANAPNDIADYISDASMVTVNHYAQAVLKNIKYAGAGTYCDVAVMIRCDGTATATKNAYAIIADNQTTGLNWVLAKYIAGAYSAINTNTTDPVAGNTFYISVSGNSLITQINGVTLQTATDTSVQSGVKVGVNYSGDSATNIGALTSFQASDLYTVGFPYMETFSVGSQNSDATNHVLTLPSGIVSGDLLVCLFSVDGSPTATINGGWSTQGYDRYSTTTTGYIFYKVATGSDSANVTTSASEQSTHIMFRIAGASGSYGDTPIPPSTTNDTPTSVASTPTPTPTFTYLASTPMVLSNNITLVSGYCPIFWVAPDKVEIGNMYSGALADTWVSDKTLDNGYKYKAGEPLCFTIYNNDSETVEYSINLDSGYYGQPPDYANWVTIATNDAIVPAQTAMNIPVSIQIPKDITEKIPHQWEFRISVVAQGQGDVQLAFLVRFVITMR